jgi:hypothetical protein
VKHKRSNFVFSDFVASQLRKKYTLNRDDGPQCNVCLRRFSAKDKLRLHKPESRRQDEQGFEYPKCHKRFSEKGNLTQHDNTVHLKLREHVCEVCGRAFVFGLNRTLQRHIRMRHDKMRSAPCFQCGKTYSSDSYLMTHVRRVIANPRCHRPTDRRAGLAGVVRQPRGGRSTQPIGLSSCPCPKCDYVADCPSHLQRHFIGRHTSNRFQCAYGCLHGYTQVDGLGVHLKEKHHHKRKRYIMLALHKDDAKPALPENDTLPHQCELCDWRFPNLKFLAYHVNC